MQHSQLFIWFRKSNKNFSYAIFPIKKNKCCENSKIMRKLLFNYSFYSHPEIGKFQGVTQNMFWKAQRHAKPPAHSRTIHGGKYAQFIFLRLHSLNLMFLYGMHLMTCRCLRGGVPTGLRFGGKLWTSGLSQIGRQSTSSAGSGVWRWQVRHTTKAPLTFVSSVVDGYVYLFLYFNLLLSNSQLF
jgi:hypothetical protein